MIIIYHHNSLLLLLSLWPLLMLIIVVIPIVIMIVNLMGYGLSYIHLNITTFPKITFNGLIYHCSYNSALTANLTQ